MSTPELVSYSTSSFPVYKSSSTPKVLTTFSTSSAVAWEDIMHLKPSYLVFELVIQTHFSGSGHNYDFL